MDLIYELMALAAIGTLFFLVVNVIAEGTGEPSDDRDDY